jgi:hypothetical protein
VCLARVAELSIRVVTLLLLRSAFAQAPAFPRVPPHRAPR